MPLIGCLHVPSNAVKRYGDRLPGRSEARLFTFSAGYQRRKYAKIHLWPIVAILLAAGCGEPRLGNRGMPTATSSGAEPTTTATFDIVPGSPSANTSLTDPDSGRIDGEVDDANGEPIAGATVTVSGSGISGTQSAITDADGAYRIMLPAGRYMVTFYYGSASRGAEVDVEGGKLTRVRATFSG